MKLWEVLKALEENPEKKFESVAVLGDKNVISISESGFLYFNRYFSTGAAVTAQGFFNGNVRLYDDWQEVNQPVTWQEALGAWALEGKTVRCVIGYSDYIFDGSSNHLEDVLGSMTRKQIKEGTWYIEEETK